jgi:hypothetical protein
LMRPLGSRRMYRSSPLGLISSRFAIFFSPGRRRAVHWAACARPSPICQAPRGDGSHAVTAHFLCGASCMALYASTAAVASANRSSAARSTAGSEIDRVIQPNRSRA